MSGDGWHPAETNRAETKADKLAVFDALADANQLLAAERDSARAELGRLRAKIERLQAEVRKLSRLDGGYTDPTLDPEAQP